MLFRKAAYEKYGKPDCIVLSGGVVSANPDYICLIKEKSGLDAEFKLITMPQVYGAGLSCAKLCTMALNKDFYNEFERTYRQEFKNEQN